MTTQMDIAFTDNPAIQGKESKYETVTVDVAKTIASWRESMFSFEWLTPEGDIKPAEELSEREQPKRQQIEELLKQGKPLAKAVLGIGLQDNIEIGIGRAHFLTAASKGLKSLPVHVPKSSAEDFKPFLSH